MIPAENESLRVERAHSVTLFIAGQTGFRGFDQPPDKPAADIARDVKTQLSKRQTIRSFSAESVNLGGTLSQLPTDEWLKQSPDDPALHALYFLYGRYLRIPNSRPGTQAANSARYLERSIRPPWSFKLHRLAD